MSGFIGDMVGSVKNNRRPKKQAFALWRKFEKDYNKGGNRKKTISEEGRKTIKQKIKESRRKRFYFDLIMIPATIIIAALLLALFIFIYNYN